MHCHLYYHVTWCSADHIKGGISKMSVLISQKVNATCKKIYVETEIHEKSILFYFYKDPIRLF